MAVVGVLDGDDVKKRGSVMRRFLFAAAAVCLASIATSAFVAVALAARGSDGAAATCASYSPWK